jgi:hypothetical protein
MPGTKKTLTGWGVSVRLPGQTTKQLLIRPGTEEPLSTSLMGARAWLDDYVRRGCEAELVEILTPRRRSYRQRHRVLPPEKATGELF